MQGDNDEYLKAFRGEEGSDAPDNAATESAPADVNEAGPSVAVVIDAEKAVDDAADKAGLPEGQGEPAPDAPGGEPEAVEPEMTPEEIQRQKSWEGRLRKREEEIAAREAALSASPADVAGPDDEEVEMARASLADDFGDDFLRMIELIAAAAARRHAGATVDEKVGPLNDTVSRAIADVQAAFANMHFGSIAEAHEDFMEIVESPDFQAFIDGMPEEQKAQAGAVIESGTPKQVIALLNEYKASMQGAGAAAEEQEDPALDAAASVRGSAPLSLPERTPASPDDEYRAAWNQM